MNSPFIRDEGGVLHVVALSGGHDSTALAFLLREQHPERPYNYLCTPTGNELPAMFEHWIDLGQRLGRRLIPIIAGTLHGISEMRERSRRHDDVHRPIKVRRNPLAPHSSLIPYRVCPTCDGRGIYESADIKTGQEIEFECYRCGGIGRISDLPPF